MTKHFIFGMAVVFLSFVISGHFYSLEATESSEPVAVQGVVKGHSVDVSGLKMTLAGQTTKTNRDGTFKFGKIPSGIHLLSIFRDDEGIHHETVTIEKSDTVLRIDLFVTNWTHEEGAWDESFENGIFLIKNSDRETGATNAYAEVEQVGDKVIYEWSVQYHYGTASGMHLMGRSGRDSAFHGGSYLIFHADSGYLRLYRTTASALNSQLVLDVGRDPVLVHDYRVELDTKTGKIDIFYNGRHVGSWTDPKPYINGQFVALRTNRTEATFSNIKVTVDESEYHPLREKYIEAYVDEVEIEYINKGVKVKGELVVSGDVTHPTTMIGLEASVYEISLDLGSKPHYYTLTKGPQRYETTILSDSLSKITPNPTRIGFETILDVELEPVRPYGMWDVVLEPIIESPFSIDSRVHEERIRVAAEAEQKPNTPDALRVMTYNTRGGYGMDHVLDIRRIADAIAYSGADIVGLQDIEVGTRRSGGVDQGAVLADMLDMEYYFEGNVSYQGGSRGNLILSRYPLISVDMTFLPYQYTREQERGVLRARIDYKGTPITVFVTQLGYEKDNLLQRERITEFLRKTEEPFILLGDFNMDPFRLFPSLHDSIPGMPHPIDPQKITARSIFDQIVRDAWMEFKSFPENGGPSGMRYGLGRTLNTGNERIDYIFVSDEFEVANDEKGVFMIESMASDHLPVVATLSILNKEL